jgi:hypothetical protein
MRGGRALAGLAGLTVLGGLAGCESTQDKSERLEKEGRNTLKAEKALTIARVNRDVSVVRTWTLYDSQQQLGAAVIELRNRSARPQAAVPVLIDVKDRRGTSVFRNDTPGIEPSLFQVAYLRGRQRFIWINDQVTATAPVAKVTAKLGATSASAPASPPRIELTAPKLGVDPVDGVFASGIAINRSSVLQRKLVIFGVGRKGGRIVAAGRSGIERLRPGKRGRYKIFFIGNPRGARLEVAAPPTVLR